MFYGNYNSINNKFLNKYLRRVYRNHVTYQKCMPEQDRIFKDFITNGGVAGRADNK